MILRLSLEVEVVIRAILATLLLKNFPGEHAPRTPLGGYASGARVRFRRTFRKSFDKGPMLHSDPGPTNSLRGPVSMGRKILGICLKSDVLQRPLRISSV